MFIQVHPRRGYLNTDILISNHGDESVNLRDRLDGEEYTLAPGGSVRRRLSAGEHILEGSTVSGVPVCKIFTVEAALKFGGSEFKHGYVFDDTPWMFVVMRDRTYFCNRETGEEFVEHSFSPDDIRCVNRHAAVVTTGSDNSVLSLDEMDAIRTFPGTELIYHNIDACIFLKDECRLVLCDVSSGAKEDSFRETAICEYMIDKGNKALYYTTEPGKTVWRLLLSPEQGTGRIGVPEKIVLPYPFACFLDPGRVIMAESPCKLHLMRLDRRIPEVIYDATIPVSEINDEEIWKNDVFEELLKQECKSNGYTQKVSLDVFCRGSQRYILTRRDILFRQGGKLERHSHWTFTGGRVHLDTGKAITVMHREGYDTVEGCDKSYVVTTTGIRDFPGRLLTCENGTAVFHARHTTGSGCDIYRTIEGKNISGVEGDQSLFFGSTGFLKVGGDDCCRQLYWPVTGKTYHGQGVGSVGEWQFVPEICVAETGTIPPRIFTAGGQVVPSPVPREKIVSVSATAEVVLFRDGDTFGCAVRKDGEWLIVRDGVFTLYDTTRVKEAAFCGDGRSFVYRTAEGLVMHDFESGSETPFPEPVEIVKNINGYRTYLDPDCLRPVSVDPVTHRRLDARTLLQYTFSNADGSLHYRCRRTKRFFRNSGAEVSDEQYAALCAEYDSNEVTEELKKKRRELYERVVGPMNWFRMGFLSDRGFVDNNIIEQKEYVVIDRLGEEHEIGVGRNLWFLNYVAFSNDSRRAIISGKYKDSSGLCIIYDFESKRNVHASFDTMAVWRGVFSSRGDAAYYDSTPDTYLLPRNESRCIDIKGRSFLTFSPSGRYMALSRQGYICGKGHVPDCDVYIVETDDPEEELAHYNDHGCEITGVQFRETVACASFSQDEGKLLTVGSDGVVVVRFLDLE